MENFINTDALTAYIKEVVEENVAQRTKTLAFELEQIKKHHDSKQIMTIPETAKYTGKSVYTIRCWIRNREVPHYREGKNVYLKTEDVDAKLMQRYFKSQTELENEADMHMQKIYSKRLKTAKN